MFNYLCVNIVLFSGSSPPCPSNRELDGAWEQGQQLRICCSLSHTNIINYQVYIVAWIHFLIQNSISCNYLYRSIPTTTLIASREPSWSVLVRALEHDRVVESPRKINYSIELENTREMLCMYGSSHQLCSKCNSSLIDWSTVSFDWTRLANTACQQSSWAPPTQRAHQNVVI